MGDLKPIKGRRKATLDVRIEELERLNGVFASQLVALETKIGSAFATLKEIVNTSNATTLVVSCVERFLDSEFGDWDAGVRKEAEARMELLKRRKALSLRAYTERKTLDEDGRTELAVELWAISRELDLRADDAANVIALHLQNRDVDRALDVVEEIRRDGVVLANEVAEVVEKLIARCVEVAEEIGNDVLGARARALNEAT